MSGKADEMRRELEKFKAEEAHRMKMEKFWRDIEPAITDCLTQEYEEFFADTEPMTNDMGYVGPYKSLRRVLDEAFAHASAGKGFERHACGEPFEQQTICQTARAHGIGFCTGQAEKKGRESHRLLPMVGGADRAVSELLGAINYLAAAVIVIREGR